SSDLRAATLANASASANAARTGPGPCPPATPPAPARRARLRGRHVRRWRTGRIGQQWQGHAQDDGPCVLPRHRLCCCVGLPPPQPSPASGGGGWIPRGRGRVPLEGGGARPAPPSACGGRLGGGWLQVALVRGVG